MSAWQLESDRVHSGVSRDGGFLHPVSFQCKDGRTISPLHRAPWLEESVLGDIPPMLRGLRGDFFCAPFGDSDVMPEETRPHGATANAAWTLSSVDDSQQFSFLLRMMPTETSTPSAFNQPEHRCHSSFYLG